MRVSHRSHRPPLRALVAFEAAARLASFNAAARDLHLTPSAISHQIASIEGLLGVKLFARVGRGIELTLLGRRYYEKVRRILATLDEAGREVANASAPDVLTIHTPPSIASKWLLPLLPEFIKEHPGIEVRLSAETGRAGFSWDAVDLAVLYMESPRSDGHSAPLLEEFIQPLCSPRVLKDRPIKNPVDVPAHTLIHTNYNLLTWKHWCSAQGVSGYSRHRGIQIDPSHVAIEAAAKDFGIVLESDVLAQDEIASGRLVAPLRESVVRRGSYTLAWSPDRPLSRSVELFRDWLLAAASRRYRANGTLNRPQRSRSGPARSLRAR